MMTFMEARGSSTRRPKVARSTNRHGISLDAACCPLHCAWLPSCPGIICFFSLRKTSCSSIQYLLVSNVASCVFVFVVSAGSRTFTLAQKPDERSTRPTCDDNSGQTSDTTVKLRCSSKTTCLHRVWMAKKCRIRWKVKADIVSAFSTSAATHAAMAAAVCTDNSRKPLRAPQWCYLPVAQLH